MNFTDKNDTNSSVKHKNDRLGDLYEIHFNRKNTRGQIHNKI